VDWNDEVDGLIHLLLVEEPDGHLLLHISPVQHLGELFERYQVILVKVCLHDCSLRDGDELLGADVVPHHHGQHGQQLLLADLVVTVQVVHPEGEVELLHPGVELVLLRALLDWSEVGQDPGEVLEVHLVLVSIPALEEEGVNDPVTERVDGELGDPEEVFSAEESFVLFIQT